MAIRVNLDVMLAKAIRSSMLDGICEALECQPGDVLEWVEE